MSRARLTWAVSLVGVGAVAVVLVLTVAGVLAPDPDGGEVSLFFYLLIVASFGLIGALLVARVPDNRVGWVMWTAGLALVIGVLGQTVAAEIYLRGEATAVATAAMLSSLAAVQVAFSLVMGFLPLFYPTGSPPSPRWRPVLWYAGAALSSSVANALLAPGDLGVAYPVPNPIAPVALDDAWDAVQTVEAFILITLIPASVLSLFSRYRASGSLERHQIKWFGAVALVMATCFAVAVLAPDVTVQNLGWLLAILVLPLLPVAVGVAILRYRLYDIDRLISRTLSYAIVTGMLGAVFVGVILVLQTVFAGMVGGGGAPVAISTLAVFALFQPVLRRVRRAVDRRFDRARFDAERTTAAFSERLRDQVDIDTVTADLDRTVRDALKPTAVHLWLRGGGQAAE